MNEDEPFLKRWSRLKTKPPAEAAAATSEAPATAAPEPDDDGRAIATEEPFDLSKLPRIEDMTAECDITGFLDSRVPQALRNAALRQMWSLDPTIRDFIEVAENQWNWNIPGGAPFHGPIEPGTDIAALLAQATGAMMKASDHEFDSVDAMGDREKLKHRSTETTEASTALQHTEPAGLPKTEPAGSSPPNLHHAGPSLAPAPSGDEAIVASQQNGSQIDQRLTAASRRHGGALPS